MWSLLLCSYLCLISVSHQLSEPLLHSLSHITNSNTQWAAVPNTPSLAALLLPPVALLQSHLFQVRSVFLALTLTGPLRLHVWWQALLEKGWSFGFCHFVKKGKISHVFSWRGQGDDRGELVAPEDLVGKVGCSNLACGGGWLDRGAHDDQQLKVSQFWVCPATT